MCCFILGCQECHILDNKTFVFLGMLHILTGERMNQTVKQLKIA